MTASDSNCRGAANRLPLAGPRPSRCDPKPPDDNRKWYGSFLITKLPVADGYVEHEFGLSDHSGNQ